MSDPARTERDEEDEEPPFGVLKNWLGRLWRRRGDASLAEAIEELIEEGEVEEPEEPISAEERNLLLNILKLRGRTADDIMAPAAFRKRSSQPSCGNSSISRRAASASI